MVSKNKIYLALEFFALFILMPLLYMFKLIPVHVIFVLIFFTTGCVCILLSDKNFNRDLFWNIKGVGCRIKFIIPVFLASSILIGLGVWKFEKNLLFHFVKDSPQIWLIVMCLYPVVSAYPQEIIYRTFLFHRYKPLFSNRIAIIIASAAAFGFMHIIFWHWLPVALTLAGGFLFASTYDKTRSTFAAALEHSLYGCFIFTIGLGFYFFHGMHY